MSHIDTLHEGEELLRRILDAVPGGVVHVGKDGSIRKANAEALRVLGLRFDELMSRFVADFATETLREDGTPFPAAEYPVSLVLTTGKAQAAVTLGVRKPNGEVSWAVFRAEPILDVGGQLAGAVVTFLDITERKRTEEDLRRSEEKWRALGQNLPDFVLMTDRGARILWLNRSLPDLDEKAVLGKTVYDFTDECYRVETARSFDRAVSEGMPVRFESRARGPGGGMVWYETQLVPLKDPDGEVTHILVVAQDDTERRAMLAGLAEKERLASVGMLAASVAHEIMNPLTYILANLDLVLGDRAPDPERRRQALVDAREGAQRMQQIVWDLRALGRAGSDELFYVDARSVLAIALRLSGPALQQTARVVLELGDVPSVVASESRLCQVFINLLVNAAQAMEGGDAQGREIRVTARHDDGANLVGIAIADNGAGIAPERLTRVFEPFYTTKEAGTGLGLSICRDIVERMGGRIDVTSLLGEGTTFTVWLPTTRESITAPTPS